MKIHHLPLAQISSNNSESFVLLGLGLLIFIIAVALCRRLLDYISRLFEAVCDRLEYKLARRKVRRRSLAHLQRSVRQQPLLVIKQQPRRTAFNTTASKPTSILSYKTRRPLDAHEALRRSCAAAEDSPRAPKG